MSTDVLHPKTGEAVDSRKSTVVSRKSTRGARIVLTAPLTETVAINPHTYSPVMNEAFSLARDSAT
jgi:hypothetical protein